MDILLFVKRHVKLEIICFLKAFCFSQSRARSKRSLALTNALTGQSVHTDVRTWFCARLSDARAAAVRIQGTAFRLYSLFFVCIRWVTAY
jgi:hypothetical protein